MCQSTKTELEKLHSEFQKTKVECDNQNIKISELNRIIEFQKEKLLETQQKLALTSKTLNIVKQESKNK